MFVTVDAHVRGINVELTIMDTAERANLEKGFGAKRTFGGPGIRCRSRGGGCSCSVSVNRVEGWSSCGGSRARVVGGLILDMGLGVCLGLKG